LETCVTALEDRISGPTPSTEIVEAKQDYGAYWSPFQGPAWQWGYSALEPDEVIPPPDPVAKRATRLGSNDPLLVDFLVLTRGRLGPASRVQGYNAVSLNAAILLCYLFKTDAWPPDRWVAHSLRDLAEVNHLTYGGTRKAIGHLLRWRFLEHYRSAPTLAERFPLSRYRLCIEQIWEALSERGATLLSKPDAAPLH
jgi:hypothetical protein